MNLRRGLILPDDVSLPGSDGANTEELECSNRRKTLQFLGKSVAGGVAGALSGGMLMKSALAAGPSRLSFGEVREISQVAEFPAVTVLFEADKDAVVFDALQMESQRVQIAGKPFYLGEYLRTYKNLPKNIEYLPGNNFIPKGVCNGVIIRTSERDWVLTSHHCNCVTSSTKVLTHDILAIPLAGHREERPIQKVSSELISNKKLNGKKVSIYGTFKGKRYFIKARASQNRISTTFNGTNCRSLSDGKDGYFSLWIDHQPKLYPFSNLNKRALKGFSGAPVFLEENGENQLVGVFNGFKFVDNGTKKGFRLFFSGPENLHSMQRHLETI